MCCSTRPGKDPFILVHFVFLCAPPCRQARLVTKKSRVTKIVKDHKEHDSISITNFSHFIPRVYQLMNKAIYFAFVFSFLYGIKPYNMKHVVKGGILAVVVICLYAFITVVASAL